MMDTLKKLEEQIKETSNWVEINSNAEIEELLQKKRELKEIFHPLMEKVYQENGGWFSDN